MLFNTALFAIFFVVFFVLFKCVAKTRGQKLWTIVLGSLVFYGAWDYRFVPLLAGTALVDFFIARAIARSEDERRRKRLLILSIISNLGVLAFFKYTNFFLDSLFGLLRLAWSDAPPPAITIILPVGISFYTFQSMSYTIDVYRRELEACDSPVEFLAAVSFFPHLVAGPIIRASTLLPQFATFSPTRWDMVQRGYLLIGAGLVKKTVADLLGKVANDYFGAAGPHSSLEAWTGVLAFTGQIYGDFSGYTDIAIGIALLLGFTLPPNFNQPYLASSPVDFWRRWHISLSSWLRDYLYIPLGGNRHARYRNLILTMLLGGLWHGASWTFVAWGLYHGVLLVATQLLSARIPRLTEPRTPSLPIRLGKILLTFYLVSLGWVLFRAETFTRAVTVLRDLHRSEIASVFTYDAVLRLLVVGVGLVFCHVIAHVSQPREGGKVRPSVLWPAVAGCIAFAILLGEAGQAFIYFQF